jgi:hypothetical protein
MDSFKKHVQLFCEQSYLTDDVKREAIVCLLLDFVNGLTKNDCDSMEKTEIEFVQCVRALIASKEMSVRKELTLSAWAVSFAANFSVPAYPGTVAGTDAPPPLDLPLQKRFGVLIQQDGDRNLEDVGKERDTEPQEGISVASRRQESQAELTFDELNKPAKKRPKLVAKLCSNMTEQNRRPDGTNMDVCSPLHLHKEPKKKEFEDAGSQKNAKRSSEERYQGERLPSSGGDKTLISSRTAGQETNENGDVDRATLLLNSEGGRSSAARASTADGVAPTSPTLSSSRINRGEHEQAEAAQTMADLETSIIRHGHNKIAAADKKRLRPAQNLPICRINGAVAKSVREEQATSEVRNRDGRAGGSGHLAQKVHSVGGEPRRDCNSRPAVPPPGYFLPRPPNFLELMAEKEQNIARSQVLSQRLMLQFPHSAHGASPASLMYIDHARAARKSDDRKSAESALASQYGAAADHQRLSQEAMAPSRYDGASAYAGVPNGIDALMARAAEHATPGGTSRHAKAQHFASSQQEYSDYLMDWVRKQAPIRAPVAERSREPRESTKVDLRQRMRDLSAAGYVFGDNSGRVPSQPPSRRDQSVPSRVTSDSNAAWQDAMSSPGARFGVNKNCEKRLLAKPKPPVPEIPVKSKRGRKKRPKDFPKRPLSGYNLFFKEERGKILDEQEIISKGQEIEGSGSSKDKDETAASHDGDGEGKGPKLKAPRKGRPPPHRKMGFENMARTISKRWNVLSEDDRSPYLAMAKLEMKRYREETSKYKERQTIAAASANAEAKRDESSDTESDASEGLGS